MNPVKYCQQCGAVIAYEQTCDYYSYIRLKYCRPCAADVRRRQVADSMRKARAAARERRQLDAVRCTQTEKENQLLREMCAEQAARIRMLESYLKR